MKAAAWNGNEPDVGDVLEDARGNRALVMAVKYILAESMHRLYPCGCCMEDYPEEAEIVIWVAADKPVEVLTPGGGKTLVAGLEEWLGDPKTTRILRPVPAAKE